MSLEVQLLVLLHVVRLLEHGHVVRAAFAQVAVLVRVHRVHFEPHEAEVLPRELAGVADVLHAAHAAALAREEENLLHPRLRDDLHFALDLSLVELHAPDGVVAVEAAVDAVVLAVVRDVEGREDVHRVAEVADGLSAGALGHVFEEGGCGRGKKRLKILHRAALVLEGAARVRRRVAGRVVRRHRRAHAVLEVGVDHLHAGQIRHRVGAARGVALKLVLSREGGGREAVRVEDEVVTFRLVHVRSLSGGNL